MVASGWGGSFGSVSRTGHSVEVTLALRPGKEKPFAEARGLMFQAEKKGNAKALG